MEGSDVLNYASTMCFFILTIASGLSAFIHWQETQAIVIVHEKASFLIIRLVGMLSRFRSIDQSNGLHPKLFFELDQRNRSGYFYCNQYYTHRSEPRRYLP